MPDSIDEQIARLLGNDARQSSEAMAKQLNISAATVRRRLRRLLDNNLLQFVGIVDPSDFGLPLVAIIYVDIDHNMTASVMEKLTALPQVSRVATTTGTCDLIITARLPSTEALSEFMTKELAQLEGIKNFETSICLDIRKGNYIPLT